jgi:hypothetical protein
MSDPYGKPPCCGADALRQVKIIPVNGIPTGIAMLDKVFDEVRSMDMRDGARLKEVMLEKVRIYNYIPKGAGDAYADALFREYQKAHGTGAREDRRW